MPRVALADLTGSTCVVTGASSGIGEETALALARLGAHVVLVGRDEQRGRRALSAVAAAGSGDREPDLHLADFASLDAVRGLADELLRAHPRIDVLVNNAGIVNLHRELTDDGYEATFAVNHLAPFLLTNLLIDRLVESSARIVNVASEAHRFGRLSFDDLQSEERYASMRVYGTSKLANILFTAELARQLRETSATANSLHPGAVATRLGKNNGLLGRAVTTALSPFILSPKRGAATSVHVAASAEVDGVSGRYFARCREKPPSAAAQDQETARRLWTVSCALTGLDEAKLAGARV